jgi:hypothetical protein
MHGLAFRARLRHVQGLSHSYLPFDRPFGQPELAQNALAAWRKRWSAQAHLNRYFELLEETAHRMFGAVPWRT